MRVSVITTEKNEALAIGKFIEGLLSQTRAPDEIVICDGGSIDGTLDIIQRYINQGSPIQLIVKPGNRSVGRNAAIAAAKYDILALTDVGTIADPNWLAEITKPFDRTGVRFVSGFFKAAPESIFEEVSSALTLWDHEFINQETWLPSGRSMAFRREVWQKVGGFPEQFSHNEDTPFDLSVQQAGIPFTFCREAVVYWRPRSTWRQFYRQYHYYAIGDGEERIFAMGYLKKTAIYIAFGLFMIAGFLWYIWWMVGLVIGAWHIWKWCGRVVKKVQKPGVWWMAPCLLVVFDMATIFGYYRGWLRSFSVKK